MQPLNYTSALFFLLLSSHVIATEVFFDDFEGTELKSHWEVINVDPDAYIVEGGTLLVLSSGNTEPQSIGNSPNIFKLTNEMPTDDWTLSTSFKVDFQTEEEAVFLGIYTDDKTFMIVQPRVYHCGNWGTRLCATVDSIKMANGKQTIFTKWLIHEQGFENFVFDEAAATIHQPIEMRIDKRGRKYRAGILWRKTDPETMVTSEEWVNLPNFTILHQKGKPVIGIYQVKSNQGESVVNFDWVRLETKSNE